MSKRTGWMPVKAMGGLRTIRELEPDAIACTYCSTEAGGHRPLFSYDNTGLPYCNKDHWVANWQLGIVRGGISTTPTSKQPSRLVLSLVS